MSSLFSPDSSGILLYFWELRSCAYWQEFAEAKIIYPDIVQRAEFAYSTSGHYLVNTLYFIPYESEWLCALLNSSTMFWFYTKISTVIRGGGRPLHCSIRLATPDPVRVCGGEGAACGTRRGCDKSEGCGIGRGRGRDQPHRVWAVRLECGRGGIGDRRVTFCSAFPSTLRGGNFRRGQQDGLEFKLKLHPFGDLL